MEHIIRVERETLKFRLIALILVALDLYLGRQAPGQIWLTLILLLGYLAYVLLLGRFLASKLATPYAVYGMVVVDAVALGLALNLSGGVSSPLFIFLPLLIIYYSIYFGYRSSLFSAVVFSLDYALLAIKGGEAQKSGAWIILLQLPFLFLVAIVSGYLSQSRLSERRLREELQEFIRVQSQAKDMVEMSKGLGQTLDLDSVLRKAISTLPFLLHFTYCVVALWDDNGRLVAKAGNIDLNKLGLKSIEELKFATDGGTTALRDKPAPWLIPSAASASEEMPAWAKQLGAAVMVVVPLLASERKIGLAYLLSLQQRPVPSENELRLAQDYGELLSSSIANAQLYQSTTAKVNQLVGELESTIQRMERQKSAAVRREIVVDELRIDGMKERVLFKGKPVGLSPTEFSLLYVLAENVGRPLNQETLLREVWSKDYQGQTTVVDVSIHRLRKKLEAASPGTHILTVRGLGYMLATGKQPVDRT